MYWLVIPARKGSKGLKNKNRLLLDKTLDIIPKEYSSNVVVTSDDEWIIEKAKSEGYATQFRSQENSTDSASTRDVLIETAKLGNFKNDDKIILLYLTFPNRIFSDVENSIKFFEESNARSMLCSAEPETHPFLCLYSKDGNLGEQVVKHNMCRRQEYPKVFMVSHYVGIFEVSELKYLNRNMYNDNTVFYSIDMPLDVDTKDDYNKIEKNNGRK